MTKLDLCLIIGSLGQFRDDNPENWQLQLDFFADLTASFPIGPESRNTRVAAIVFSEEVQLAFPLNRFNSVSEVQEAILSISHLQETTNTPEAFRVADTECFNAANGDRDDADNVIIIATDGFPYPGFRRNLALTGARRLKNKGISIFAVGITPDVDEIFLRGISSASKPFRVTNFTELHNVVKPLFYQVCACTFPHERYENVMKTFSILISLSKFNHFLTSLLQLRMKSKKQSKKHGMTSGHRVEG